MSDKVLARVEDKEITESTISKFLTELGPQVAMQFANPEGQKRIVEELVNQELIYLDALEAKVHESEDFLVELEKVKEGLLKQYAIAKLLEDIKVDDEDAKKYYEENKEIFVKPAMVTANHILVDTEEEALELRQEIEEGLSFEEAAAEHSKCPSKVQGGNLGQFGRGQMVPEFEAVAFELEVDELSEPVKTDHGYHLILLKDKSEEGISSYEEVAIQLKNQLLGVKQQEKYIEATNELKDKYEVEINL